MSFPSPLVATGYQTTCSMLMESLLSSVPLCSVLQDIFASSSRFCFPIPPSSSHLFFPPLLAESYRPSHPIFLPVYSKYSIYLKQFTASGLHRCHRKCCLRSRDQVSTLWGQFPVVPLVPSAVHPCLRCMMQEEPWGSAVYMAHHAALRGQRPELCITCGCPSTRVVFLGCGWGRAGLLPVMWQREHSWRTISFSWKFVVNSLSEKNTFSHNKS